MRIGVLALQGDFREHEALIRSLGHEAVPVKRSAELDDISGLIIPGGESTAISKLLVNFGLMLPIRDWVAAGKPVLATCAGMILLADEALGALDDQQLIGGLDITVARNAYGSQNFSFEADIKIAGETNRVAFIRAPRVIRVGPAVTVLATHNDEPVALEAGNLMAASFHPEITGETRLHELFLQKCGGE